MTTTTAPKLPRGLMTGGSSVAIIARPIQAGTLAHKSSSQTRELTTGVRGRRGQQETYYITACAAADLADADDTYDADDAYLVTAAWADHLGAVACTEPACFPNAH